LPRVGTQVNTPQGKGVIVGLNVLTESALVELQSELTVEIEAGDIEGLPPSKEAPKSSGKPRKKRRHT
jgi:hypothetical protein